MRAIPRRSDTHLQEMLVGGKQMRVGDRGWEGDVKSLITKPCINRT